MNRYIGVEKRQWDGYMSILVNGVYVRSYYLNGMHVLAG